MSVERRITEAQREKYRKRFQSLTIKNDFMFCKVMQDEEICSRVINLVLKYQQDIPPLRLIIPQANIENHAELKSIRLDVLAEDEKGNSYDIEMQVVNRKNIEKRIRAYQAAIDGSKMSKGMDYSCLTDTVIIFICLFDLFGKGLALYSFENYCTQDKNIKMKDGSYRVILNALAWESVEDEELRALLKYIATGIASSELTRRMEMKIETIKKDTIITDKNVSFYASIMDARRSGRSKGRREGLEKGIKKGILVTAKNLFSMGLPIESIMQATGLSKEELEKL